MSIGVAIVSADPDHWEELSNLVSACGLHPVRCKTLAALNRIIWQEPFKLAICDDELPDGNYRQLINTLHRFRRSTPVVVVSRFDDSSSYLDAMLAGAFDCVALSSHCNELECAVAAALTEGFDEPVPTRALT
jgi:DNA-binding NtrC family response regulator